MPSVNEYDVVIIGGGIAGVSSAYHIAIKPEVEGSICLLEARNRLGGRIHAMDLPSKTVELGANWIHGMIGNPVYEIARKNKLVDPLGSEANPSVEAVQGKRYFVCGINQEGQKIPLSLIEECYNTYFWFTKQAESYFSAAEKEGKDPPVSFNNSVGKHLIHDIEKHLESRDPGDFIGIRRGVFKTLLYREACISGSHSIEDVSLRDFGAYEELPGGNLIVEGGYISIVNILLDAIDTKVAERLTAKSSEDQPKKGLSFECRLNHEVVKVKWKDDKQKQDNRPIVEITCSNGNVIKCNHVIVSLPLGVLKEDADHLFSPCLPDYKVKSINSLGFSVVDKIFCEFKNKLAPKFLDASVNEFLLIWTDDDLDDETTIGKKHSSSTTTNINNNNNPEKAIRSEVRIRVKENSPRKWWRTIYSFSRISEYALMGWLSGQEAQMVESLDPVLVGKSLTEEVFRKFFHPEFPEPESVYVTKWKQDKFSRGSYTFISKESSSQDIDHLCQPIYSDPGQDKPIMMFAGESCHPNFFSTVHGAFLSGKKAASYLFDPESLTT